MKQNLATFMRANPRSKKHEKAVREALKALDELKSFGFHEDGYELSPSFGGKVLPSSDAKRMPAKVKMTYCA